MPIEKLRVIFWVKGPRPSHLCRPFLWAAIRTHGGETYVTGKQVYKHRCESSYCCGEGRFVVDSAYMNAGYSSLTGLKVIIGLFSYLAVNMPDFGRVSENNLAGGHHFLVLTVANRRQDLRLCYRFDRLLCPQIHLSTTFSLVEVAIYPLKLGETYTAPTVGNDGASESDLKDPRIIREKEVV